MICYAFALSHEGKEFVAALQETETFQIESLHCTVGKLKERTVLVAFIGMGLEQAEKNTKLIFQYFRFKVLILAGYGGSLVSQIKNGQVVVAQNYSNEELVSFVKLLPDFSLGNFCTCEELVVTPDQKAHLAITSRCQVVDMETASVFEIAVSQKKCPFLALRVISDQAHETLPAGALKAGFDPHKNKNTPLKLLLYLLFHPFEIKPFKNFVARLPEIRSRLTAFLLDLTDELPSHW